MFKDIIRILIILLGYSQSASAAEQNLVFSNSEIVFGPTVTEQAVSVSYATVPESTPTSGLGIKMFFDSSKLSIESLDLVLTQDLIGVTDSAELFHACMSCQCHALCVLSALLFRLNEFSGRFKIAKRVTFEKVLVPLLH